MKKFSGKLAVMIAVVVIALMVIGTVAAVTFMHVDGTWDFIENPYTIPPTTGFDGAATCDGWGTGTMNNILDANFSATSPSVQGNVLYDENEVRYGRPEGMWWFECPDEADEFVEQSGFGFDGVNNVGTLGNNVTFEMGRATHYNHPITASNTLAWVDIYVAVDGVTCADGLAPTEGGTLSYVYQVAFDETPNGDSPCKYSNSVCDNSAGCCDRVVISTIAENEQTMTCTRDSVPVSERGVYTIQVIGLIPDIDQDGDCTDTPLDQSKISTTYYTKEGVANYACMWGIVTNFVPTDADIKSFTAVHTADGVAISWKTVSENRTLGFNLYRSATADGEQVLVNSALIPSNVVPGSNLGADYAFTDGSAAAGVQYYYWLEEVESDGSTNMHGPAITAE
ncbi:MAG TPA: hypothetical protein PK040_00915 [Anaerolineaceae bacterium]|nr:hypothetical protein [Anaerolineaceae bacterium]